MVLFPDMDSTTYVHMVREGQNCLLCSHGKRGRALLVRFIWLRRESTTYVHMVKVGKHSYLLYSNR